MSDLNSVTKRLIRYPSREITDAEAINTTPTLKKFHTARKPARDIKKVSVIIEFAQFLQTVPNIDLWVLPGYHVAQANYTMSKDFYITDIDIPTFYPGSTTGIANVFFTVKWRVGEDVSRYLLVGSQIDIEGPDYAPQHAFPIYQSNIKVNKNFSIELWCVLNAASGSIGTADGTYISTSILIVPSTGDETSVIIASPIQYNPPDMALAIPFDPATNLDNSVMAHLTN